MPSGDADLAADGWQLTAEEEERQAAWYAGHRLALYRQFGLRRAGRVLEVGCGSGVIAAELGAWGAKVVGLERRRPAATAAQGRGVTAVVGDAARLPFGDQTFGAVVTAFALTWFAEPAAFLGEARRVLRKGGYYVALAEPDYGGLIDHPPAASLKEGIIAAVRARGGTAAAGRQIPSWCARHGLELEALGVINSVWTPRRLAAEEEKELALWERLMGGEQAVAAETAAARRRAALAGERFFFLPIFYAAARRK